MPVQNNWRNCSFAYLNLQHFGK